MRPEPFEFKEFKISNHHKSFAIRILGGSVYSPDSQLLPPCMWNAHAISLAAFPPKTPARSLLLTLSTSERKIVAYSVWNFSARCQRCQRQLYLGALSQRRRKLPGHLRKVEPGPYACLWNAVCVNPSDVYEVGSGQYGTVEGEKMRQEVKRKDVKSIEKVTKRKYLKHSEKLSTLESFTFPARPLNSSHSPTVEHTEATKAFSKATKAIKSERKLCGLWTMVEDSAGTFCRTYPVKQDQLRQERESASQVVKCCGNRPHICVKCNKDLHFVRWSTTCQTLCKSILYFTAWVSSNKHRGTTFLCTHHVYIMGCALKGKLEDRWSIMEPDQKNVFMFCRPPVAVSSFTWAKDWVSQNRTAVSLVHSLFRCATHLEAFGNK